jgi:hypothetical protein
MRKHRSHSRSAVGTKIRALIDFPVALCAVHNLLLNRCPPPHQLSCKFPLAERILCRNLCSSPEARDTVVYPIWHKTL